MTRLWSLEAKIGLVSIHEAFQNEYVAHIFIDITFLHVKRLYWVAGNELLS